MSPHLDDAAAWTALVHAIHRVPVATVLELAGGIQGLAWLHAVGGSSATVLEAHDRYHGAALATALGTRPSRATDPKVADVLAVAAWERARVLASAGVAVVGLGCTAAMVTERRRRGDHMCHVATWDGLGSRRSTVGLTKGVRDRVQEEAVVGRLVLLALAIAAGVEPSFLPPWPEPEPVQVSVEAGPGLEMFLGDGAQAVSRRADGTVLVDPPAAHRSRVGALLSGAFNPVHEAHRGLREAAAEFLGMDVSYELPVMNADKLPLDVAEVHCRSAQFLGRANLWLTRAAFYSDKAALFPGAVFVVGADTAERVLQPRFYGGEQRMRRAVAAIGEAGCRFLVAARPMPSGLLTLGGLQVPAELRTVFVELPADRFCLDRSSTRIRDELAVQKCGSGDF